MAGSGADDGGAQPAFGQDIVHHPTEQLHGNVLERQRRPVEEFQDEGVGAGLHQRRDGRMAETAIGIRDHCLQDVDRDGIADEGRNDFEGDVLVGLAGKGSDGLFVELRPGFGKVETAVAGKPLKQDIGEFQDWCLTTRTDVFHRAISLLFCFVAGRASSPARSARRSGYLNSGGFETNHATLATYAPYHSSASRFWLK